MDVDFFCIAESIRVGVLVSILDTIPIGVLSQWIRAQNVHLDTIIKSIIIGVVERGVGLKSYFLAIVQSVLICVSHLGGCTVFVKFFCIRKTVPIRVLFAVNCPVPIRVPNGRVGANNVHFDAVSESIVVGVGNGGIGL